MHPGKPILGIFQGPMALIANLHRASVFSRDFLVKKSCYNIVIIIVTLAIRIHGKPIFGIFQGLMALITNLHRASVFS